MYLFLCSRTLITLRYTRRADGVWPWIRVCYIIKLRSKNIIVSNAFGYYTGDCNIVDRDSGTSLNYVRNKYVIAGTRSNTDLFTGRPATCTTGLLANTTIVRGAGSPWHGNKRRRRSKRTDIVTVRKRRFVVTVFPVTRCRVARDEQSIFVMYRHRTTTVPLTLLPPTRPTVNPSDFIAVDRHCLIEINGRTTEAHENLPKLYACPSCATTRRVRIHLAVRRGPRARRRNRVRERSFIYYNMPLYYRSTIL